MIRYLVFRILSTIPTIVGISFLTFILLNLAISNVDESSSEIDTGDSSITNFESTRAHLLSPHLPLFLNLSVLDARARAEEEIDNLADDQLAPIARRTMAGIGGAWLPYLIPALNQVKPKQLTHLLGALEGIAERLELKTPLSMAPDQKAFWLRYWETYGADFRPVRAARLARRLVRRHDELAWHELRRLDTFCLPQLMEVLEDDVSIEAKARIIGLVQEIVNIEDPLHPDSGAADTQAVLKRWNEWWKQRYDHYTVFEGADRVLATVSETRYFKWLVRLFTMDFGVSVRDGRPIRAKLWQCLPVTMLLSLLALIGAYAIAVPLGIISAVTRGRLFDRITTVVLFVLYSFPAFWMAILVLRYFTEAGGVADFPSQGLHSIGYEAWPFTKRIQDTALHLVLPVICLSVIPMAMLARYQRVGMIHVINRDFMRTARAKGLSRGQVIIRHGLRNGIIPMVTMLGVQIPYLVSGSVVVERIFSIPGMGYETFEAIRAQDQPWLLAVVTVTAILTMLGVIIADAIYALIDPRIVPGRGRGGGL